MKDWNCDSTIGFIYLSLTLPNEIEQLSCWKIYSRKALMVKLSSTHFGIISYVAATLFGKSSPLKDLQLKHKEILSTINIANFCTLEFDIRWLNTEDQENLIQKLCTKPFELWC